MSDGGYQKRPFGWLCTPAPPWPAVCGAVRMTVAGWTPTVLADARPAAGHPRKLALRVLGEARYKGRGRVSHPEPSTARVRIHFSPSYDRPAVLAAEMGGLIMRTWLRLILTVTVSIGAVVAALWLVHRVVPLA